MPMERSDVAGELMGDGRVDLHAGHWTQHRR
ncbi:hypothetical protein FHU28_005273 [Micromonospora echinospora]|uniref:Uncharacterized protein n=1 Tax=Micromonospora echinospora TaxID=1877 RepID=A0ABR6MJ89_MICEC|nr:hypothetical protein [Micromonospora echinospora]